jgi:Domain of unknown function (DUF4332)
MATRLSEIECIDAVYCDRLISVGIHSVEQLLDYCGRKQVRAALAGHTGISENLVLAWVNRADLCRVPGVKSRHVEALRCCSIESVADLARCCAHDLYRQLSGLNSDYGLDVETIADWIEQARQLPPRVSH